MEILGLEAEELGGAIFAGGEEGQVAGGKEGGEVLLELAVPFGDAVFPGVLGVMAALHVFPGAGFAELVAEGGEPGEVAVEEAALVGGIGDGVEGKEGEGTAGVDDGAPDLAGFPEAGVGGVVFEAGDEGDGGADHGDGEPWDNEPTPAGAEVEEGREGGDGDENSRFSAGPNADFSEGILASGVHGGSAKSSRPVSSKPSSGRGERYIGR